MNSVNSMIGYYGFFPMFMMMLFWILLTIGIVLLVKWFIDQNKDQNEAKNMTALEAAQLRYARGEISREEFEEIKKNLEE
ncbi:MAG: putative rane protein [Methanolobus sp.]|jgi:putative membrane protein|nr:putative rane protein [Methanolobus sp.]MDK2912098.1 putative rane protein [Methanolobus sp.]MDN5310976.1 putative rane protein [Methanolobus sp.]